MFNLRHLILFSALSLRGLAVEHFFCNSAIHDNFTESLPIQQKYYAVQSTILCAALCYQLNYACTTYNYSSSDQICTLHAQPLPGSLTGSEHICQRNFTELRAAVLAETATSCHPSFSNYQRPASASCPSFSTCTCNSRLTTSGFWVWTTDDCFTICGNNAHCLGFSIFLNACYLATQPNQLTLTIQPMAFTCYCQKPSTTTTVAPTISKSV